MDYKTRPFVRETVWPRPKWSHKCGSFTLQALVNICTCVHLHSHTDIEKANKKKRKERKADDYSQDKNADLVKWKMFWWVEYWFKMWPTSDKVNLTEKTSDFKTDTNHW